MNQVFISYRHESVAHAAKVREFAEALQAEGLPVALDQLFVTENPGGHDGGWARWCIDQAEKSACVLVVCSKGWFDAAQGGGPPGKGIGVAAEASIIRTQIFREKGVNARVRFVIVDGFAEAAIPNEFYIWNVFKPAADPAQAEQMRSWIRQRLAMPSSSASQAAKVVYLAPCIFDLRIERANLTDFLTAAGWQVRPAADQQKALADDLRESLAFIQLLESYPREDDSHRTQFAQARAASLTCFRFRHNRIVLDTLDAPHRALLTEPDVMPGSFDDFKLNLLKDLEAICTQKHAPKPYASREILVRVAIRASQPDPLWDEVFAWIDAQAGIRPALLEGTESFKDKHDPKVPCHGFLIVCDRTAQEGATSTKIDLEQCMEIQLRERNDARRPPVGLVFWPPPDDPLWPRLIRVFPPKLHRIVATAADDRQTFFDEVRRCAS